MADEADIASESEQLRHYQDVNAMRYQKRGIAITATR